MDEKQVSYLSRSIAKALSNAQEVKESKRAEDEAKLHQHHERVEQFTREVVSLKGKCQKGREVCDDLVKRLESFRDEERALRYKIEATENELTRIKQCQSNSILAYGKQMPDLLRRIKKAKDSRRFKFEPKGPLGQFVKVRDRQWNLAVECCLGANLLNSFLCDNDRDKDVLYEIMNALYPGKTPQVITRQFTKEVYDVSSGKVERSGFCTVLDMLDIVDPDIINCLVDERGIETIILIPRNDEARRIMMYKPPERCTEAYTLKANSVYPTPSFRFYANRKKTASLISDPENLGASISEKTKELALLKQTLPGFRDKIANAEKCVVLEERGVKQCEMKITQLQSLILQENAEIKGVEVFEEPAVIVHSLENELKKTRLSLENSQNNKNEKEFALKSFLTELRKVESDEERLRELREEKNSDLVTLSKAAVTAKGKSSDSFLSEKNKHEVSYKEESRKHEDVGRALAKQMAIAKEKAEEAEKVCPRVRTKRKPQSIDMLIEQTKECIARGTENEDDIKDIIVSHEAKRKKYEEVCLEIKSLKTVLKRNQIRMRHRLQVFEDLCIHVGYRVKYLFSANLHTRGYVGELKIDHREQTLEISARPNHSSSMQSTKSLSGGEKSFITVALLLSLWDAIEIPFRILDEYDVYMDQMNRKRSMDLMMATALEHCTNQFIFLSPLEQVQIPSSKKIRIMHMPNPERQQKKKIRREDAEAMDCD